MPPNAAGLLSHCYQVHIKVPIDKDTQKYMKQVAEKYGCTLAFIERYGEDIAVIYRPKK